MAVESLGGTCPTCGGTLEHVGSGKLECPFCGGTFFDEKLASLDKDEDGGKKSKKDKKKKKKDKEKEELTDDDIADIVADEVDQFDDSISGVQIGLGDKMSKENKARDYFNIPDDEEVFMLYDETVFGSCKEGYAITDVGLHMCFGGEESHFEWVDFAEVEITETDSEYEIMLDDVKMTLTAPDCQAETIDLLDAIQDDLYGDDDDDDE